MADKKPEAAPPADAAPPAKKKLPIKTVGVVAVLMVAEAAAVFVVLGMGGPSEGKAETHEEHLLEDDSENTREIELVTDKFQNLTTGRVWVWDLSVYVQVKNKNAEQVERVLEQRGAEIREGINQIVGRAQHTQLKEPERQTMIRQITAFLEKIEGLKPDEHAVIERVLIPRCRGFPSDY